MNRCMRLVLPLALLVSSGPASAGEVARVVTLNDFDSHRPAILVAETGQVLPAPARHGRSKRAYNQYVMGLGDLIFDHTGRPNVVIPSGAYRILKAGGDLTAFADRPLDYGVGRKRVVSGGALSAGGRLLIRTSTGRFLFAEIVSVDTRKMVLAYTLSSGNKAIFTRKQLAMLRDLVQTQRAHYLRIFLPAPAFLLDQRRLAGQDGPRRSRAEDTASRTFRDKRGGSPI
jgi:hypothetical protein